MSVDLSPAASAKAFSSTELDFLASTSLSQLLRNPTAMRVLVARMLVSLHRKDELVTATGRDFERLMRTQAREASPMAAAVKALGELTPYEQRQVFSSQISGLIEEMKSTISHARTMQVAARSTQNRMRLKVGQLLESSSLDEQAKSELLAILDELPASDPVLVEVNVELGGAGVVGSGSLDDLFG